MGLENLMRNLLQIHIRVLKERKSESIVGCGWAYRNSARSYDQSEELARDPVERAK
jgi:hypothetical protein